jgi:ferritin-like metal-binding protein YciE
MQMMAEKLNTLNDLFMMELKDIYNAEKQIIKALPKMIDAASSPNVKQKFQSHLHETENQVKRLENVFSILGVQPEEESCKGMEGIIDDGKKVLTLQGDPKVKDAALIAAAQKVEHYEISSYGTLRTFAETLGKHDVAQMLQTTLKEESKTDELLTQVAESSINPQAAHS